MKILFIPDSMLPIHANSIGERPLGGMETAVIRLSEALEELGHNCIVITKLDNPPLSHPLYLPIRSVNKIDAVDILITIREWKPALLPIKNKATMFWTGDSYDLTQSVGIGDLRVAEKLNSLLCVSSWHADTLSAESGFPREKCYVLRNGIHLPYFDGSEERKRKRLMYSSAPFRGLKFLPQIYKTLKEKHPELELHIFSDYAVYSETGKSEFYEPAIKELAELRKIFSTIPGCFMHGNVKQSQLAREMMRSSILSYPSDFEETSCITAMEAQAAGCVFIGSHLGALPETVGDAGILLKEPPGSSAYINAYIEATDKVLSDDAMFNSLSKRAQERSQDFSWKKIAQDFSNFLNNFH